MQFLTAIFMDYIKEAKSMISEKYLIENINKEFYQSFQYLLNQDTKLAKEKIEKGMELFEYLNTSTK